MRVGPAKQSQIKGFTLIELLIVISIIAILAAILFPVFARARENGRRASCMSNLKQISLGLMQYVQDYDERFPNYNDHDPPYYPEKIQPYVKSYQVFRCPSQLKSYKNETAVYFSTYPLNGRVNWGLYTNAGTPLVTVATPAITWMLFEQKYSAARWESDGWGYDASWMRNSASYLKPEDSPNFLKDIHLDGSNVAFADGHVKWVKNGQGGVGYKWNTLN